MKKIILLLALFTLPLISAMSQSLQNNPDYIKSLQLRDASDDAFEEGDYVEAKRLAEESKIYAARSDAWIQMMLSRYKANSALRRVEVQIRSAQNVKAETNFPEAYASGLALYEEAYQLFRDENYEDSYEKSLEALEVMSVIEYIPSTSGKNLPAAYEVQLLPGNTDCLWNIAGYDFIYGDSFEWKNLWEANKELLQDPKNPSLIQPGIILQVPSINGESRSGTWKNGAIQ